MSNTAIKVENLSKIYRLGEIGSGSIGQDVDRWFKTKVLGKEDPFLKIGEANVRANKANSDIVYSLCDINFDIEQGDAVGIIGRNGAGKSTLLKILSRVTTPTTGKINIKGRVASLLEVGTGFHPELTGRENIYLNGAILGMRKREIDRKLDEIIDFSGVERFIDTPVKRYSSGMYVRLAFAVAAHLESEILIVDEVLAVGDAEFQKKCLGKMGEVSKGEGRTVLFVSHNLMALQSLCDKGLVLKDGALNFVGKAVDAVAEYQKADVTYGIVNSNWVEETAPGDYRAKILSASAKPTKGNVINFSSGITLTFVVKSMIDRSLIDLSFDLKNQDDVLLLHHGNYISDSTSLVKGVYQMEIKIPPFFLNEGNYYVNIWLGLSATEMLGSIRVNAISFFMESVIMDHYLKYLPGVSRPRLEYNTTLIYGE